MRQRQQDNTHTYHHHRYHHTVQLHDDNNNNNNYNKNYDRDSDKERKVHSSRLSLLVKRCITVGRSSVKRLVNEPVNAREVMIVIRYGCAGTYCCPYCLYLLVVCKFTHTHTNGFIITQIIIIT